MLGEISRSVFRQRKWKSSRQLPGLEEVVAAMPLGGRRAVVELLGRLLSALLFVVKEISGQNLEYQLGAQLRSLEVVGAMQAAVLKAIVLGTSSSSGRISCPPYSAGRPMRRGNAFTATLRVGVSSSLS